jgi:hypothetical protein
VSRAVFRPTSRASLASHRRRGMVTVAIGAVSRPCRYMRHSASRGGEYANDPTERYARSTLTQKTRGGLSCGSVAQDPQWGAPRGTIPVRGRSFQRAGGGRYALQRLRTGQFRTLRFGLRLMPTQAADSMCRTPKQDYSTVRRPRRMASPIDQSERSCGADRTLRRPHSSPSVCARAEARKGGHGIHAVYNRV